MGEPRRNEPRFYRYPMRRVVSIIDDTSSLEAILKDLASSGIDVSTVNVLSGQEGARLLDRSGATRGLRGRVLRLLQKSAYEYEALVEHETALNAGRHVLYVPVRTRRQRRQVVDIMRNHGGYGMTYFSRWSVEHIPT